jgi:guanosine-3',5'-bis(diphosphate) 3'-pyrophosphohydrolase
MSPPTQSTALDELIQKVLGYDAHADTELLTQAYYFSQQSHAKQVRASGKPFFEHPLAVAHILADLHLDVNTIITGLLHDTVEDTKVTSREIRLLFGKNIAFLVDGVTKITHIESLSTHAQRTEQYKKLLVAVSSDIRVLLVKLADRLHNMRTLYFFGSEEKKRRIARETINVYVPLAERIGLRKIKDELEDLAFTALNPDARHSIISRLKFLKAQNQDILTLMTEEFQNLFKKAGIKVDLKGREKTPYSIWLKMQKKNTSFENIADIIAFRILVESIAECYQVLGILHSNYHVIPGRFKDYLSLPKKNKYASLHTTLIGPFQRRVEIQIRTHKLEKIAEFGVAAHWEYKQGFKPENIHYKWLRELLELLEHSNRPEDFLAHTKLELFQDQVFCFSPKGDLLHLPKHATAIDFAYAVHSNIGNHCVGAKINGQLMPLKTELKNGDQVEILTSELQSPVPAWEHFAITPKAKANIRRFVRKKRRGEFEKIGKSFLEDVFQKEKVFFSEENLLAHLSDFSCDSLDDLYVFIGEGRIQPQTVLASVFPEKRVEPVQEKKLFENFWTPSSMLPISGLPLGVVIHFASCCYPLPGDRIFGLYEEKNKITIHRRECKWCAYQDNKDKDLLDLSWSSDAETLGGKYIGRVLLKLVNQPGALAIFSTLIAKMGTNIIHFKIQRRTSDYFEILVDLELTSVEKLEETIGTLKVSSWILSVERWNYYGTVNEIGDKP